MPVLPKMFSKLASQTYAADPGSVVETIANAADFEPGVALPLIVAGAVGIPMLLATLRGRKNTAEDAPEPAVFQEYGSVSSIFEELTDARNRAATDVLDSALADLLEEQSWDELKTRLDAAVNDWARGRTEGADNTPDHDEMVRVLFSLIRNLREAAYREQFAKHYRQVVSVDRRDRSPVEDVFVCLEAEGRGDANGRDEPGLLDFRGLDAEGIEGRLREADKLVIVGGPGSGKSTMLRYLAAVCAASETDKPLLPIFLNLRDYADGQEVLIAESAASFAEGALQLKMSEGFFEDALRNGRCLVCLDALDEVPKKERRRVVSRVEQLAHRYHDNRLVVTSRRAGYDDEPLDEGIFKRYAVQPMDDESISDFIDRNFGAGSRLAEGVRAALDDDASLRAMASNPMQLAMLNLVYRDDDREGLRLKRTGFYQAVVEKLIPKEDGGVDSDYADHAFYQFREHILVAIAHHLHSEERETIGRNPLLRFVAGFLEDDEEIGMGQRQARREAEVFVELAERRTGLLVGQRAGRGVEFHFLHATFQEYLAARHIYLSHLRDEPEAFWREIEGRLADDFWREVIVFLLTGFEEDQEEYCTYLSEKILAAGDAAVHQPDRSELPTHLQLAADALANQAPMSPDLQRALVGRLERLGKGPYSSNWRAIRALAAIRHIPALVTAALTTIASDPAADDWARREAAEQLLEQGEREEAIGVLKVIAADPEVHAWTRGKAAERLAELGEREEAIGSLRAIAADPDVDDGNRVGAAEQLGEIGESEQAIAVLTVIVSDPEVGAWFRGNAAEQLAELGEREQAIALLTAIADGPGERASLGGWPRVSAAEKLGELGEREKAIETLTAITGDSAGDAMERADAAEKLGELGEREKAIETLTAIISDLAVDAGERAAAANKFEVLGEREKAIEALTAIAGDRTVEDRDRVHFALDLAELEEEARAKEVLAEITAIPTATHRDRAYAAGHLAALGGTERGIEVLTAIAIDSAVDVRDRMSAALDLGDLGERETVIEVLTAIAIDPAVDVRDRVSAARYLRGSGQEATAVSVLTAILSDSAVDASVRVSAAGELAELDEREKVIEVLTAIATDSAVDAWDRGYANRELAELVERERVVGTLTVIAGALAVGADRRVYAAAALWKLGETDAASTVLTSLANEPADEREKVIEALTEIATEPEIEALDRDYANRELAELAERERVVNALTAIVGAPEVGLGHRVYAAAALWKLGEMDVAVAVLTSLPNEPANDTEGGVPSAWEPSGLGERDAAIEAFSAIANDPAAAVEDRRFAAEALEKLGG